ncbi:MAG: phytanoyl-CoA dioxygenase family protein [Acidobacteriota bacterium]
MSELATRFAEDGHVAPLTVLSEAEAGEAAAAYEEFQAQARAHLGEEQRFKVHLLVRWLDALVHDPRLVDHVESVLGPDILCWSTDFFVKPASDPSFVSFHQDSAYAGLEPVDGVVNAWLALTPSRRDSGCLRVVPGSHRLGRLDHDRTDDENNMLFFGQTARLGVDEERVIDVELAPGQASLHHLALVHGSGPNVSKQPRIGLVVRYVRADVRQLKARDSATLVRGRDRHGHFDLEPRPESDWSEEAIAAFRDAIGRPSGLG